MALWIPEALGREAFTHSAVLLAGTKRLVVATGIANIWARDAMAMAAAQKTLAEAYPDRFLLGMGVIARAARRACAATTTTSRSPPCAAISTGWTRAPFIAAPPPTAPPRVLAALHPKRLELAARARAGARIRTSCRRSTPRKAREDLGPGKLLAPEQMVCSRRTRGRPRGRAPGDADVPGAAELRAQPEARSA